MIPEVNIMSRKESVASVSRGGWSWEFSEPLSGGI